MKDKGILNKNVLLGLIVLTSAALLLGAKRYMSVPVRKDLITIGIIQTVSHPALDDVREGYIEHLKKNLGSKVEFVYQNAEGSISSAHSIAKSYHNNSRIKGILAIGTPVAQAMANIEKIKPIYIAAITDPQEAGLLTNNKNVCGTNDMIDVGEEISIIKKIVPQAKTVAILYNPAEVNSVVMVKTIEKELKKVDLISIKMGVNSDSEVAMATTIATRKADVIITPTDNLIVAAMPQVAAIALKHKTPLFATDNPSVKRGALASRGVNYIRAGRQTAAITMQVLQGKSPKDLPIQQPRDNELVVNENTLKQLGLMLPAKLADNVIWVR